MELIYLYIEDDGKNIKDCEFNFSPEYRFHYDNKKNELTGEKLDYIENFWEASNISNITAIIGKNGAGKSNLLRFVTNQIDKDKRIIYIFSVNNNFFRAYTTIQEIQNNLNIELIILSNAFSICTPTIFYNTNIYSPSAFINSNSIDVSIRTNIVEDSSRFIRKESIYAKNIWLYHKYSNTIKQLDFLNEYPRIKAIKLPNRCFVRSSFIPLSRGVSNEPDLRDFADKLRKFMTNTINKQKVIGDKNIEKAYLYVSLIYELYCYCKDTNNGFDWGDPSFLNPYARAIIISMLFQKKQDEKIGMLLIDVIQLIDSIEMEYEESTYGFLMSFRSAQLLFNKYFKLILLYKEKIIENKFTKKSSRSIRKELFEQKIDIEWEYNMSSGEQMFLNFYSNIYFAKKKLNTKSKYMYLILDEPEITFHPEWQRGFIANLKEFISDVFSDYQVQIILASHSPILISDFPKGNIIFLNKDDKGDCKVVPSISRDNTFGANIHTLYRNSFFLDGIPIGEFAKNKINKIFNRLENDKEIDDNILSEIQLIGEPLIRDQLMKLYKQRKGLPEDTERRIRKLEKEIEILKGKLNDKN